MTNIAKLFSYQGNEVTFRNSEGVAYVNATEMAKFFGKLPNEYLRLPTAKELIGAIAGKSRISENQLVIVKRGSSENGGGTWLHETVALDFAQWLSVDFKLWCNDRIKELLNYGITATPQALEDLISDPDTAIKLLTELKKEREEIAKLEHESARKSMEIDMHVKTIHEQAPTVEYAKTVLDSMDLIATNVIAKEMGMSAISFNKLLNERKIMYKQNGVWLLYSQYQNKGYAKTKTHTYIDSSGQSHAQIHTYWTQKGRKFLHSLFNPQFVNSQIQIQGLQNRK